MTDFSDEGFPKEIEVIPLSGHFFDMAGFRMPDGVIFLADCISSRETLDKVHEVADRILSICEKFLFSLL